MSGLVDRAVFKFTSFSQYLHVLAYNKYQKFLMEPLNQKSAAEIWKRVGSVSWKRVQEEEARHRGEVEVSS